MTQLTILNLNEQVTTTLSDAVIVTDAAPLIAATCHEELAGLTELKFSTTADSVEAGLIREDYYVVAKVGETFKEFIIDNIVESDESELIMEVSASLSAVELNDSIITTKVNGTSPDLVLQGILKGTRWTVGTVDPAIRNNPYKKDTQYKTVLEAINDAADTYNCDIFYSYVIDENKVVKRQVNLFNQLGSDSGKRFEVDKDITSIKREIDTTLLVTAILPIKREQAEEGKEETVLTLANVDYTSPDGNGTSPKGQLFISDKRAKQNWGRLDSNGKLHDRVKLYEYTDEDVTVAGMADLAWMSLGQYTAPKVTYTASVIDLYSLLDSDFSHEKVVLGDTVAVIDRYFTVPIAIKERVIEIDHDLLDPTETVVTLGSAKNSYTSDRNKADETANNALEAANTANSNAVAAIVSADGKNTINFGTTAPTDPHEDDVWFKPKPDDPTVKIMQRWDGVQWVDEFAEFNSGELYTLIAQATQAAEEAKAAGEAAKLAGEAAQAAADEAKLAGEDAKKVGQEAKEAAEDATIAAENAKKIGEAAKKEAEEAKLAGEDAAKAGADAQVAAEEAGKVGEDAKEAAEEAKAAGKDASDKVAAMQPQVEKALADADKANSELTNLSGTVNDVKTAAETAKETAAKAQTDAANAVKDAAKSLSDATTAVNTAKAAQNKAVESSITDYAQSASGTTPPTTGWQATRPAASSTVYTWERTRVTLNDGTVIPIYNTSKDGATGGKGDTGVGKDAPKITKVTPQYYLSTSNTSQTGGSWGTSIPTWSKGKYYWSRYQTTFDDGTTVNSSPVLDQGLNQSLVSAMEAKSDTEKLSTTVSQHATELESKADKDTVNKLSGTVTSQGTKITQNAEEIDKKANSTTVDTLSGKVTEAETAITQNANEIKRRATQETVDTLSGRVTKAETSISEMPGKISAGVSEAKSAAATDATTKANNALATAKNDATTKANQARSDAEKTAKGYVDKAKADARLYTAYCNDLQGYVDFTREWPRENLLQYTSGELRSATWSGYDKKFTYPTNILDSFSVGDTLTLRVYLDKPTVDLNAFLQFRTDGSKYLQTKGSTVKAGESGYSIAQVIITSQMKNTDSCVFSIRNYASSSATVSYGKEKLELGSTATPYLSTPDPESENYTEQLMNSFMKYTGYSAIDSDDPSAYSWEPTYGTMELNKAVLDILPTQIKTQVSTLKTDTNGKITSINSTLTQHANQIDQRVTKDGLIGQINTQAGKVLIRANDNVLMVTPTTTYIQDATIKTAAIADLAVTNAKIANATLTNAKIGDAQIYGAKIKEAAIESAMIKDLAVTNGKIANLAVSAAKMADATITNGKIGNAEIYGAKIKDAAITEAKIGSAAVTTAKIGDLAVTNGKIANLAVNTAKIALLAVTEGQIGNLAVTTGKIKDLAVSTAKIAGLAVTEAKIGSLAVTEGKIGNAAITTAKIKDASITSAKVIDLDVDKLSGNKANLIEAGFVAANKYTHIDSDGINIQGSGAWRRTYLSPTGFTLYNSQGNKAGVVGYLRPSAVGTREDEAYVEVNPDNRSYVGIGASKTHNIVLGYGGTTDSRGFRPALGVDGNGGLIRVYRPLVSENSSIQLQLRTDTNYRDNSTSVGWFKLNADGSQPWNRIVFGQTKTFVEAENSVWIYANMGSRMMEFREEMTAYKPLNMNGYAIKNNSDRRLKKNIMPTSFDSLEAVRHWQFVNYEWRASDAPSGLQFGLIAQDSPEIAIHDQTTGFWSIDSSRQIMVNSHAIQQLDLSVRLLTEKTGFDRTRSYAKLAALKGDFTALQERVRQLETEVQALRETA